MNRDGDGLGMKKGRRNFLIGNLFIFFTQFGFFFVVVEP